MPTGAALTRPENTLITINCFAIYLTGVAGFVAAGLAWWGALSIAYDITGWLSDRFELDMPSWRPWTWRAYRRWFAPGRLVETDDYEAACVQAVDFGPTRTPLDTWVQVQPEDVPAIWLPLADLMPAAVGPFADDIDSEITRDDVAVTA